MSLSSNDSVAEQAYIRGRNAAWRAMLRQCLTNLGDPEGSAERWRLERGEAIAQLRMLCDDFGDNDWPDNLHLAHVIEKHLGRHLQRNSR